MRLALADQVHGAVVDGDLVLLDVDADSYFCLPAGDHALALDGRVLDAEPFALAAALLEAGLTHEAEAGAREGEREAPSPRRTARALLEACAARAGRPTWRHLQAIAHAVFVAHRSERAPFAQRLEPRPGPDPSLVERMLLDLGVYRRVLPWLPIDGACLFRSQMLRAYLRRLGHDAAWRFGVRTWPFRAHCWLQVEDVALDDEAERLLAFQPIMTV